MQAQKHWRILCQTKKKSMAFIGHISSLKTLSVSFRPFSKNIRLKPVFNGHAAVHGRVSGDNTAAVQKEMKLLKKKKRSTVTGKTVHARQVRM